MIHQLTVLISVLTAAFLLGVAAPVSAEGHAEESTVTASDESSVFEQIDRFIAEQKIDKTTPGWKEHLPKPPKLSFDSKKSYTWKLETSQGPIVVRFMPDVAPMHVSSTIYLTRLGFYDDTIFHRVIPRFMAQGGDPRGQGTGGPGYEYDGEFKSSVKHNKGGLLSMANRGPGTDGSQFFLTFVETPWLDGKHTIFGEVVEGTDTLKKLEERGTRSGAPTERIVLQKATVSVE
jgi:cyclophilin family peptidyl-prolyl cis-trans isomerase